MGSSSYRKKKLRQFVDDNVDDEINDKTDEFYDIWMDTYKEVLKYWDFKDVEPSVLINRLI